MQVFLKNKLTHSNFLVEKIAYLLLILALAILMGHLTF